jgi:hypothetical protein
MSNRIVWIAFLAVVLGLLCLGWGLASWLRRRQQVAPPFRVVPLIVIPVLAVFLLGLAGVLVATRWSTFLHFFSFDHTATAEELEELKKARLDPAHAVRAAGSSADPAQEWPQWRGAFRDGISTFTGMRTDWDREEPKKLWDKPIQGGYASIAVVKGTDGRTLLYTMDKLGKGDRMVQERVLCLHGDSGDILWEHRYDTDYAGLDYGSGPRATPAVHDGRVYSVGANGTFLCLEAEPEGNEAKVLWQHDLLKDFQAERPRWGVACSPLVDGDRVYVQPGGRNGSVAAYERKEGKLVWKALADPSGYSSPVAADLAGTRQIVAFTGHRVVGIDAVDGRHLWSYDWATEYECNVATPIVAGDYVFISSNYQSGCALIKVACDGDRDFVARAIFVRHDGLMRNHFSTCVLHQGYLYGFDVTGHGGPGFLKCIDIRTFEESWQAGRDPHVKKGCLIYADGHLLTLSEEGWLALVEATPQEFRKKGKLQVLDGSDRAWALPAFAAGRLYLRDSERIVCYDLAK